MENKNIKRNRITFTIQFFKSFNNILYNVVFEQNKLYNFFKNIQQFTKLYHNFYLYVCIVYKMYIKVYYIVLCSGKQINSKND